MTQNIRLEKDSVPMCEKTTRTMKPTRKSCVMLLCLNQNLYYVVYLELILVEEIY